MPNIDFSARIHALRLEISRISTVTLRGDFINAEDRLYWVERLKTLNGQLSALEQMSRPCKKAFFVAR
jgi:hypothetical protein